jgi:hypothetical protein
MASLLKVDALTGVTTAGSISVTGEGNSTTTNLQQGLAKVWAAFGTDASLDDSHNASSATDNGTADFSLTATNATATINTAVSGSIIGTTVSAYACMLTGSGVAKTTTVTRFKTVNYYDSISYMDVGPMQVIIHGDLA